MGVSIIDRNASFTDYISRASTISVATENQQVFILPMIDVKFATEQVLNRKFKNNITTVNKDSVSLVTDSLYTLTRSNEDYTFLIALSKITNGYICAGRAIGGSAPCGVQILSDKFAYLIAGDVKSNDISIDTDFDILVVRFSKTQQQILSVKTGNTTGISQVVSDISETKFILPSSRSATMELHAYVEWNKILSDAEVQQAVTELSETLKSVGVPV